VEADRLRSITSTGMRGAQTKIVALGIGGGVSATELEGIASAPKNSNVIRVQDFSSLSTVEDQLRSSSCTRTYNVSRFTSKNDNVNDDISDNNNGDTDSHRNGQSGADLL